MSKRNKIIYWIATIWLSLGMVSSGIVQFLKFEDEVALFNRLGYPSYFLTVLAVWKFLGVIVILIPKYPILKEWAYAGFFFAMSGAFISHLAVGSEFKDVAPPVFLMLLTFLSWYFRPADRKPVLLIAK